MKKLLIFVIAVVIAQLAWVAPAGASGVGAYVSGGGSGALPSFFGPLAGDTLEVALTAKALPDGRAQGRFHFMHVSKDGVVQAELLGTVSCLAVSGTQASATGTITTGRIAEAPGFDPAGQTVAITIVDAGTNDLAGIDLSFFGTPHAIAPCQSIPLYLEIDQGNYAVSA